jgi:hypothetical protein
LECFKNKLIENNIIDTFKNDDYLGKKARVTADVLNIRWDRGTNFEVISKLKKDDIVKLQYCLNNWISIICPRCNSKTI